MEGIKLGPGFSKEYWENKEMELNRLIEQRNKLNDERTKISKRITLLRACIYQHKIHRNRTKTKAS